MGIITEKFLLKIKFKSSCKTQKNTEYLRTLMYQMIKDSKHKVSRKCNTNLK